MPGGRNKLVTQTFSFFVRIADMWTMQTLSDMVGFLFPEFELGWIVNEFRENLTSEFDFTNEAK